MDQLVEIQTIKPHSAKQEIIMKAFQYRQVKEIFVACGTKFGKSISASTALTNGIFNKPGGTWRWIAPIYRQAKIGMDYFNSIAPPSPHSELVESKMLMNFPNLESRLEFWHTQRPVDLEGAAVQGQVGDEAAKMPYDAYISANTTTTFTQGLSMWISTPWGKNWFYKKFMEAQERMNWAISKGKIPDMIAVHAPTSANPLVDKNVIDLARRRLSDRMFRQYYLAEFLDDGSVFINFRKCAFGSELQFDDNPTQFWFDKNCSELDVVIGVDWAKHKDYTVFFAIDPMSNPRRVVGFTRFQGVSYTIAVKELWNFTKRFESVGLVYHDKTGVGDAIDDMLAPIPLNIKGISFTNPLKSNLVNSLGLSFELENIQIPNWPELIKELDAFEVLINKLGTTIYNAPMGMHDDTVMALGLANLAATEYAGEFDVRFLEELPDEKDDIDSYYADMIGDDDDPF